MSVADADSPAVSSAGGARDLGLEPEQLWDLHGSSLYAMACALLGEESAALRTVTLGMMDLYRGPEHAAGPSADDALRAAAACVYRRCRQIPADDSMRWSMTGPPVMARLADLALLQRRAIALCVFGGHSYRGAATLLDIPPSAVARLLISGLRQLALRAPTSIEARITMDRVERACALYERAAEILMLDHGLNESHAVEMLCRQAATAGSTVVEAAEVVIAGTGFSRAPSHLRSL